MSIKNKYNLGDRLWPVQSINGTAFVQRPFDCLVISLHVNEPAYGFTTQYAFPETNVFDNEADAVAECERRNQPR